MIIQTDIKEKKTVHFSDLESGDIFSYEYPPTEILMKLAIDETFLNEAEDDVRAIYLSDGAGYPNVFSQDFVYPLTGKLIITG